MAKYRYVNFDWYPCPRCGLYTLRWVMDGVRCRDDGYYIPLVQALRIDRQKRRVVEVTKVAVSMYPLKGLE